MAEPDPDGPPLAAVPAAAGSNRRRSNSFEPLPEWVGMSTRAVHAGRRPEWNAGAVVAPIYQTSTFHYPAPFSEASESGKVRIYTRYDNPTQEAAAEVIRELEGAGAARVFSSGMAAITTTLLSFARSGDEIAAPEELYGGVLEMLGEILPRFGISIRWIPADAPDPSPYLTGNPKVVFLESPTNPFLRVHDLRKWAEAADAVGAFLVVDNTFATPVNQRPLELGADLVVHSASKYLGGHSDLIAGAVAGPSALVDRIVPMHRILGGSLDPFAAFLLLRGLKTLALRVARQNENGRALADALASHPAISRVFYPGRGTEEQETIAARQMSGRGGMVSFSLKGGAPAADRFLRRLRLAHVAASLGGVESLVSLPSQTSHAHLDAHSRAALGIDDGFVRLSVGVEETRDILREFLGALDGL